MSVVVVEEEKRRGWSESSELWGAYRWALVQLAPASGVNAFPQIDLSGPASFLLLGKLDPRRSQTKNWDILGIAAGSAFEPPSERLCLLKSRV